MARTTGAAICAQRVKERVIRLESGGCGGGTELPGWISEDKLFQDLLFVRSGNN